MVNSIMLIASLASAQSTGTFNNLSFYNQLKLANIEKRIRALENGRPTITGTPTFQDGIIGSASLNVLKAGDTMTGSLLMSDASTITIQGNAFSVGASTLVVKNGRVGINEPDPVVSLDVRGIINVSSRSAGNYMRVGAFNSVTDKFGYYSSAGQSGDVGIKLETTNNSLVTGATRLTIKSNGFVGIGTDSPSAILDVAGQVLASSATFGTGANISSFSASGVLTLASDLGVSEGGTGASTLTDGGVLFGNAAAAIGATAVLTNGQLLIGDGTGEPTLATLTATDNETTVNNGVGSITIGIPDSIVVKSTLTVQGNAFSVGTSTLIVSAGNVGVGTANPVVVLDISSAAQGLGVPVLTSAQVAASTPGRAGAIIYNSTISLPCISTGTTIMSYSRFTGVTTCQ